MDVDENKVKEENKDNEKMDGIEETSMYYMYITYLIKHLL